MSECGLSEREKNKRVKNFGKRVDRAIQLRAKRSCLFEPRVARLNSELFFQSLAKRIFVINLHQADK